MIKWIYSDFYIYGNEMLFLGCIAFFIIVFALTSYFVVKEIKENYDNK